jgi:hypothetical protein
MKFFKNGEETKALTRWNIVRFFVAFLLDLAYNLTLLRFYGHRYSVENCQDWRRNESVGVVTMLKYIRYCNSRADNSGHIA